MKALLALALFTAAAQAQENFTIKVETVSRNCEIDVRVQGKPGKAKGDILFFPGFADCKDNHDALFRSWQEAGYRVISFNYPEHGKVPKCKAHGLNDTLTLTNIRKIAREVEEQVRRKTPASQQGPLTLAGWSTGGLVAASAEKERWFPGRDLRGMVLFAPAIAVDKRPWKDRTVKLETLAPGAELACPLQPSSPETMGLGGGIALKTSLNTFSPKAPTISILASNRDAYIDAPKVKAWSRGEPNVLGFQCLLTKGRDSDVPHHAPDLTPETSEAAIAVSTSFLKGLDGSGRLPRVPDSKPCFAMKKATAAGPTGGDSGQPGQVTPGL